MNRSDDLESFVEMAAVRWKRDPRYRQQLMREAKPTIAETLRRERRRAS
jgi:hypothetical protein